MSVEYLTIEDVAKMLKVDRRIASKILQTNGCPSFQFTPKSLRVDKEEFQRWIKSYYGKRYPK